MELRIESVFRQPNQIAEEVAAGVEIERKLKLLARWWLCSVGLFGFIMGVPHSFAQGIASAIKLPLVLAGGLVITLPALHYIGLHAGSQLRFLRTLVIIMVGMVVSGVLMLALSPVIIFFLLSGAGYSFSVLLHVAVLAFALYAGMMTISRSMRHLAKQDGATVSEGAEWCLMLWIGLYGFVLMQLSWMLRPMIGAGDEFVALSALSPDSGPSNFFEGVFGAFMRLLKG